MLHESGADPIAVGQENAALARARALGLGRRRIEAAKNGKCAIGLHSARQGSMALGHCIGRALAVARKRALAQGTNAAASVDRAPLARSALIFDARFLDRHTFSGTTFAGLAFAKNRTPRATHLFVHWRILRLDFFANLHLTCISMNNLLARFCIGSCQMYIELSFYKL